jgi:hypothetical protein
MAVTGVAFGQAAGPAMKPVVMAPATAGNPPFPVIVREETAVQHAARFQWLKEVRFGLLIHWGCTRCLHGPLGNRRIHKNKWYRRRFAAISTKSSSSAQ